MFFLKKRFAMRCCPLLLSSLLLILVVPVHAFTVSSESQNTSISSPTHLIELAGYTQVGLVADSTPVNVIVAVPLNNIGVLQSMVKQISTPGSETFHHFLTMDQVKQLFLPTDQFKSTLSSLQESGFKVEFTALDSMIVASGTAAQVRDVLGLNVLDYSNGSSSYYCASGSPTLQGVQVYASNVTSLIFEHPISQITMKKASVLAQAAAQANQTAPIESYSPTALQSVYGATALYSQGLTGQGTIAGILEFYGDPYIFQQLQYFDQINGLPAPPNFYVETLGQYNPSLGIANGWADEVSLDVEAVHTMAPGANILLYEANGALPLAPLIAYIVQEGAVDDLCQSFGIPESDLSSMSSSVLNFNVILSDNYYMIGSVLGMTFIASTGDGGGSGFSAGPEGTPTYPSTSPYVTAAGGTTTYVDFNGTTPTSWLQTAWSNYGFVPFNVNSGGGTGGISIYEPAPWYQSSLPASPLGYTNGRKVPDVSLNANVYPGINIVLPENQTAISGGTSESSALLTGLLTLAVQYNTQDLGIINPAIYSIAANSTTYTQAFVPITFGYNIPWTAAYGYNLVTGWGAIRIDGFAQQIQNFESAPSLAIYVNLYDQTLTPAFEFNANQTITIIASIYSGYTPVTTGSFTANLQTLLGITQQINLSYNSSFSSWFGNIAVPASANGLSYVNVNGTSNGVSGSGFSQLFAGYFASFLSPLPTLPTSTQFGVQVEVFATDLDGNPINSGSFSAVASTYSIMTNTYSNVAMIALNSTGSGYWTGWLNGTYPNGPIMLAMTNQAYGYLPFMNGVDLQPSFILPPVIAEPGVVAPGQSISVEGKLLAPLNLPNVMSYETGNSLRYDVEQGSTMAAILYGPSGNSVANKTFYLTPEGFIGGTIDVPANSKPGLYTIILYSSFSSATISANIQGSFFAQVYVAPYFNVPAISTSPSALFEGQTMQILANITYSNGTQVKYGMYSATLYPRNLQNSYSQLTQLVNIPLFYNAQLNEWVGSAILPSLYNNGGSIQLDLGALYLSGPFEVYISGLSADGVPTTTDIFAQHEFYVQPYLYVGNQTLSSVEPTSGVAFIGDTISPSSNGTVSLSNDIFVGTNTLKRGTFEITSSRIQGTLQLDNASVLLVNCVGGNIVAQNSNLSLVQSSVDTLTLNSSHISLSSASYTQVTPALPLINVQSPILGGTYNGALAINASVTGQSLSSISLYLDGKLLTSFGGNTSSASYQLDTTSIPDGVHTLSVVAAQQDGLSASSNISFNTNSNYVSTQATVNNLNNQVNSLQNALNSLNSQLTTESAKSSSLSDQLNSTNAKINSLSSQLDAANATINSLNSTIQEQGNSTTKLMNEESTLTLAFYAAVVLAVAALAIAAIAVGRKKTGNRLSNIPKTATQEKASAPGPNPEAEVHS